MKFQRSTIAVCGAAILQARQVLYCLLADTRNRKGCGANDGEIEGTSRDPAGSDSGNPNGRSVSTLHDTELHRQEC